MKKKKKGLALTTYEYAKKGEKGGGVRLFFCLPSAFKEKGGQGGEIGWLRAIQEGGKRGRPSIVSDLTFQQGGEQREKGGGRRRAIYHLPEERKRIKDSIPTLQKKEKKNKERERNRRGGRSSFLFLKIREGGKWIGCPSLVFVIS